MKKKLKKRKNPNALKAYKIRKRKGETFCNITHVDDVNKITIKEKRQFLINQRKRGRLNKIGGMEKTY